MARKKFNYFAYFQACTEQACKAAQYLHDCLSTFDAGKLADEVRQMHSIENDADMLKHEMLRVLAHEFLPPIELEDIVALSHALDDVVDAIDDVMQHVYIYNVRSLRPEALAFSELIVKCCAALATAAQEFQNFKKSKTIQGRLIEINAIEEEADHLFNDSIRKLYTGADAERDVFIWTRLFDLLENCLDACEDAADIIEGIIMKNT